VKGTFGRRLMLNRVEATQVTGALRREVGGATVLLHPLLPASSWNFAVDVDSDAAQLGPLVQRVEAVFKEAKRWPAWILGPYDRPDTLEKALTDEGYSPDPDRTVMYAEEAPRISVEPPPGLEVEYADDLTVDECVQIAVQRYGWPYEWAKSLRRAAIAGIERGPDHYRMYIANLNGSGVATAFVVFSGGTAGLYGMATSKDFEGKGIGRALLARCIQDSFSRDIDLMTLQVATGSMAEKFYAKAGFKTSFIGRRLVKKGGDRTSRKSASAEEE
jgi:GNAT superfamily N-acetyltransferase